MAVSSFVVILGAQPVVKYCLLVNSSITPLGNDPIFLRPVFCGSVIQWKGSINCLENVSTSPLPKSILVGSLFSN